MHPKLHWIFKYLHILNGYFHWIIAKDSPVCPLKERLKLSTQQLLKKNKPNQTETKHTEITILLYILFIRFTFHMPLCWLCISPALSNILSFQESFQLLSAISKHKASNTWEIQKDWGVSQNHIYSVYTLYKLSLQH